jgi:hypothetical protein
MKVSFGDKKTKHKSKNKRKMHHWCLCHCWLLLGATTWNLTTLGSHLVHAFRATHSKFTKFTFYFYKLFYKSRHAKDFIVKRVSKGQHAITNMKSVKVFFEHCCCLAFFFQKFTSASWFQTRTIKEHLVQKMPCSLSDEPRKVLLGTLGFAMVM